MVQHDMLCHITAWATSCVMVSYGVGLHDISQHCVHNAAGISRHSIACYGILWYITVYYGIELGVIV